MKRDHDRWIIGESATAERTYVIHTQEPRFIGEVFDEDDADGILSSCSFAMTNGQSLANLIFIDDIPGNDELTVLLSEASELLAIYDTELGILDG